MLDDDLRDKFVKVSCRIRSDEFLAHGLHFGLNTLRGVICRTECLEGIAQVVLSFDLWMVPPESPFAFRHDKSSVSHCLQSLVGKSHVAPKGAIMHGE